MDYDNGIIVQGKIVKKTSKNGKPYFACEVPLTDGYTATFFPQPAEVALLQTNLELLAIKKQINKSNE